MSQSKTDITKQIKYTKMNKKITRLTLNDLSRLVENTAKRVMKESIDQSREIQLAYKEIQQMGKHLSSLGLRLDGTPYYQQYQRMKEEMIKLNNALIAHMKGGRK
jgi:uncharacterized protein YukE